MQKTGVLLVNLGTPTSTSRAHVHRYLSQFLMDERVIDINVVKRTLLVKGIIAPVRSGSSAKLYKEVWTDEGSPLLYHSIKQQQLLQQVLGAGYHVALGMRYQFPSVQQALTELQQAQVSSIIVVPMFPQYASATTGSVMQQVMRIVSKWFTIPPLAFVNSFYNNPAVLQVFADNARQHGIENFDHIMFSFHGLPVRQLYKSDVSGHTCKANPACCAQISTGNQFCYSAQCYATARGIAALLNLPAHKYTVCFQSRLGKDPWIEPFTSTVLHKQAQLGSKRLLVFSPAFVADCLETLQEISVEYNDEFKKLGGEHVQLVESLNEDMRFINALAQMVTETRIPGAPANVPATANA